jgi:hypothetical protein
MRSVLITSQQSCKNTIENPSGPEALSRFIPLNTSNTYFSSKGNSKEEASTTSKESKARLSNPGLQGLRLCKEGLIKMSNMIPNSLLIGRNRAIN